MATPGDLVETISRSLGVPARTVALHDRALAEAGYRKSGGRGRSAAKVGPEDAANLLIAVVGTPVSGPTVKDTINSFIQFRDLVAYQPRLAPLWSDLSILQDVGPGRTFGDALTSIIRAFCEQKFDRVTSVWTEAIAKSGTSETPISVDVEFMTPAANATINIFGEIFFTDTPIARRCFESELRFNADGVPVEWSPRMRPERLPSDLDQKRHFSEQTLRAVGDLLREDKS